MTNTSLLYHMYNATQCMNAIAMPRYIWDQQQLVMPTTGTCDARSRPCGKHQVRSQPCGKHQARERAQACQACNANELIKPARRSFPSHARRRFPGPLGGMLSRHESHACVGHIDQYAAVTLRQMGVGAPLPALGRHRRRLQRKPPGIVPPRDGNALQGVQGGRDGILLVCHAQA